ncbi:hypothetical protein TKK_0001650 [Trichogramma kaykai]
MFIKNWAKITTDKTILSWLSGVKIQFSRRPVQRMEPKTPKLTAGEENEIFKLLGELMMKGAIKKCKPKAGQFLSSIFLRQKADGSHRLILNLKGLNKFIDTNHFKLEDGRTVAKIMEENCYMASIDLKDAYYLIPMHKSYRKYLRFKHNKNYYEFSCLAFGLNIAPYIFTKLLKPVVAHLRNQGLKSVIYSDDLMLFGKTYNDCLLNVNRTKALLIDLGFIINDNKKSKLIPSLRCKYLGFIYDSQNMTIELPEEKVEKIKKIINLELNQKIKIRKLAEIVGYLTSCCSAVNYSWLYTKSCERAKFLALKSNKNDFNRSMNITFEMIEELTWWKSIDKKSKNTIKRPKYDQEIFSDASLTGWGAVCNGVRTHGHWNNTEKNQSINFLELMAAYFGLKIFTRDVKNCQILLHIDNTTAISYINQMGGVQYENLNTITRRIWQLCENKNIWIFATYIASADNKEADLESRRIKDNTEFQITDEMFNLICCQLGEVEIDLFATRENAKCKKYVSWHKDPKCYALDAFTIEWKDHYFYAFPPFSRQNRFHLEQDYSGVRNLVRQVLTQRKIPEAAMDIVMASLTNSSYKQYETSWKKWWSYCRTENINPLSSSIGNVMLFLTHLYETGSSYSTLNCHRSAVSLLLGPEMAQDDRMRRFFRGLTKLRPSKPKYDYTWDPKIVLNFMTKNDAFAKSILNL